MIKIDRYHLDEIVHHIAEIEKEYHNIDICRQYLLLQEIEDNGQEIQRHHLEQGNNKITNIYIGKSSRYSRHNEKES